MKKQNRELLQEWLKKNHLKETYICEQLDKSREWVSQLLNGHRTIHAYIDAVKINHFTNGHVPVTGW